MNLFPKLLRIAGLLILFGLNAYAQNKYNSVIITDTYQVNFSNLYPISSVTIIPNSEIVKLKGRILDKNEYSISYVNAYFSLSDTLRYSIYDTISITYRSLITSLKKEYKRRSLVIRYDDKLSDSISVLQKESTGLSADAIFGRDMQKSGSIVRGFTFGTTRDFTLNSGLRLQLSGKLSNDIEIVAALTDENTPIQPEGNTERLDELDKVFIELRHPNAVGTFGDYDLKGRLGEFGSIDRKLQGLKGVASLGNSQTTISVASSKGKFNNNQFTGIDGVQGPYRLSGLNNERDIIVIAGSEKVYIDGEEMKRGERNDYTIDYSIAEIRFTANRLITSASRISVDFEYSDRRYARNFFGTSFLTNELNDRLKIRLNYFREGDNQDSPIDLSLSDADKQILQNAGNDKLAASRSGITDALPDSLGQIKGIYSRMDTLINNKPYSYYTYNPGKGKYNVSFSYLGLSQGDYVKENLGNYRFVGLGQGQYMPVVLLPIPELKQMGNFSIEAVPFSDVSLNLEFAGSLWNKNRFSPESSEDNSGSARNIVLNVKPQQVNVFNTDLGKIGFSYRDRFIQDRFTTLDRINEVEFSRNYNIINSADSQNEVLREASLNISPIDKIAVNSMYGYLKRGDRFVSKRFVSDARLMSKDSYNFEYRLDYVNSRDIGYSSGWYRQSANASYLFGKLKPFVSFIMEDKKDNLGAADSLLSSSLKYYEVIPGLEMVNYKGVSLKAQYSLREDSFPLSGFMQKESRSSIQSYEVTYRGISEVSSTLNFTLRDKKYADMFKAKGLSDNQTILIRSQNHFNFWQNLINGDLYYEGTTQRASRLERVFVKVPQGTGNYKYIGDTNNNGIADQREFEPTLYDGDYIVTTLPSDELYPVVDLKVNTRWKISFDKVFSKGTFLGTLLSPVSTEIVYRIEENSKETDTKKIYMLHLSSFLNDSTTVTGLNIFQQDLFLFENSNEFSIRLRYLQSRNLTQFSQGTEKGFNREKSIRIKFRMIEEVSNQTDIINQTDNVIAPVTSNRARMISGNTLTTDFSYRPAKNVESGLRLSVARNQDDLPLNPTIIDQNSETLRLILSFAGSGRFRFELERNELIASTELNYIPFELTRGNLIGKNYFWRLNFEYRLANNLQSTVGYDGRSQGSAGVIHTARAELRAFF